MTRRTISGTGATASLVVALLLGLLTAGAATARSQDDAPVPASGASVLPRRCLDPGDAIPARPGPCSVVFFGSKRPTVVLWGDSHAWQQVPALEAQAERTRTNLVVFLMGACPPMDLRGKGYGGVCAEQNKQALKFVTAKIDRGRPVKLVLGAFWALYRGYHAAAEAGWTPTDPHDQFLLERADMFADGGSRLFRTLGHRDVPTAAIAQVPWIGDDPAACSAGEDPYACDLPRATAIQHEAATARWLRGRLARIKASGYIDTTHFLCNADVCHADLAGKPVYLDALHLDPAATGAFAPEYRDLFS